MRSIRVSEDVWAAIAERGKFGETEDDVLRRVFDLPPANMGENIPRMPPSPRGRGSTRDKNDKERHWHEGGRYFVKIGGHADSWVLPDRSDKPAIRIVKAKAADFGREHGARQGQSNAIQKGLTDEGYYVTGPRPRAGRAVLSAADLDV